MSDRIRGFTGEYAVRLRTGSPLVCAACQGKVFAHRPILLNTSGATFFGVDWANENCEGLACVRCGRIQHYAAGFVTLEVPPEE